MPAFAKPPKRKSKRIKIRMPKLPQLVDPAPLKLPEWKPGGAASVAMSARHHTLAGTSKVSSVYNLPSARRSTFPQAHKHRRKPKLSRALGADQREMKQRDNYRAMGIRLTGRQEQIIEQNKQQMNVLDKIWDDLDFLHLQKTPRAQRLRLLKKHSPIEQMLVFTPRIDLTLALERKARLRELPRTLHVKQKLTNTQTIRRQQNLNAAINGTEVAEVQNTVGVLKAAFVMIMLIPCRARLDNWQKAMGRQVNAAICFEKAWKSAVNLQGLKKVVARWHRGECVERLHLWRAQCVARLARIKVIMLDGIEEDIERLVQGVADTVQLNPNGSMNEEIVHQLAKRARYVVNKVSDKSAVDYDPNASEEKTKILRFAEWLAHKNMAAFKRHDPENTGEMDSGAIVFSARAFLRIVRSRLAALEVNPDHFTESAARMRNDHEKVLGRRIRRQWIELMQAKLVKNHAVQVKRSTLSTREQQENQSRVAAIISSYSAEALMRFRECVQQVMQAHRLVMRNAQARIRTKNPDGPELLPKKKKSSGDGKIISHSKVREARKIFYQYAGADAKLDVNELSTCARKLGIFGLTDQQVNALFTDLDMNNNGTLDFGEFLELYIQLEHDERRSFAFSNKKNEPDTPIILSRAPSLANVFPVFRSRAPSLANVPSEVKGLILEDEIKL